MKRMKSMLKVVYLVMMIIIEKDHLQHKNNLNKSHFIYICII